MSYTNTDEELVKDIQDDWQEVDFRSSPPESTSPDVADDTDGKASRKREREISLEPATPKEAECVSFPNVEDRRTPATKKNRLQLDSTAEEEETPPSSPNKSPIALSTSPPHESKVRQIREKVRVLSWEERDKLPQLDVLPNNPNEGDEMYGNGHNDTVSLSIHTKHRSPSQLSESDSDDQEKNRKRKLGDRSVSGGLHLIQASSMQEPIKRARDEAEEDVNPREKKRPTPPPEEQQLVENSASSQFDSTEPEVSQIKPNGFLSYASAKSPFANTAGPSLFRNKLSPFDAPSPGSSEAGGSASRSLTISPSAEAGPSSINEVSPLGVKRTGFEAFASVPSPFAVSRPKSPTGSVLRSHASSKLDRSKSPPRRPLGTANAFSSYAGSASPFAAPPVKKQRQEQDSGSDIGDGEKESINGSRRASLNNGESVEASEDDSDRQRTFSERLRASKQENGSANSEKAENIITVTEQERQTGEEHDDTLFQVRAKLYALGDQKQWKERGTGLLKLNVRKSDGGGARLLMRKEAVFTLLLNAPLFKGMRCSLAQDPRFVRFSIIEGGATVHYNLRLANAKVAGELLEEINANIPGEEERESSETV